MRIAGRKLGFVELLERAFSACLKFFPVFAIKGLTSLRRIDPSQQQGSGKDVRGNIAGSIPSNSIWPVPCLILIEMGMRWRRGLGRIAIRLRMLDFGKLPKAVRDQLRSRIGFESRKRNLHGRPSNFISHAKVLFWKIAGRLAGIFARNLSGAGLKCMEQYYGIGTRSKGW